MNPETFVDGFILSLSEIGIAPLLRCIISTHAYRFLLGDTEEQGRLGRVVGSVPVTDAQDTFYASDWSGWLALVFKTGSQVEISTQELRRMGTCQVTAWLLPEEPFATMEDTIEVRNAFQCKTDIMTIEFYRQFTTRTEP